MILFVSGRSDIPTYYPKWFYNRVKEGFVDTRNPFNPKLVSRIFFKNVDIIVFCSKNIHPLLPYLDEIQNILNNIQFVFHLTLTPYNEDIEPIIAKSKKIIIEDINFLAKKYGKDNIFIRYDPILKNKRYTIAFHLKAFNKLLPLIKDSTENIVISFVDYYKNTIKNNDFLNLESFSTSDYKLIGENFSKIAHLYKINIFTCGEKENLTEYGFDKGACISKEFVLKILNKSGKEIRLKRQTFRKDNKFSCNCVQMVDIGAYNSCLSFCKYCYANYSENEVLFNFKNHDDNSSLLIGKVNEDDIIKERK